MNTTRNKIEFSILSYENRNALSVFKQSSDKKDESFEDMSIEEVSEVVSEKIMEIIRQQFEETKAQIEAEQQKK